MTERASARAQRQCRCDLGPEGPPKAGPQEAPLVETLGGGVLWGVVRSLGHALEGNCGTQALPLCLLLSMRWAPGFCHMLPP